MRYNKPSQTVGAWVKSSEITVGTKGKLVSEALPQEGEFGTQDVAKIRIEGDTETKNIRINKPSIAGLISAFGEESKDWMNKNLTLHTEKMLVGGKRVTALYLIPEGFELSEDGGGYLVIVKIGEKSMGDVNKTLQQEGSIDDIPIIRDEI